MPIDAISAAAIRQALTDLRKAEPLTGSPLIGLSLLDHALAENGMEDSAGARSLTLGHLLDETCGAALAEARGLGAPAKASQMLNATDLSELHADFEANHIDREALGLIQLYYFDPSRLSLLQLAARLDRSRRTLRRRIDRGYRLLAECLREKEMATCPVPRPEPEPPSSKPESVDSDAFVGRKQELQALHDSLTSQRLVCLTGPAGIGKSRLAAEFLRVAPPSIAAQRYRLDLAAIDPKTPIEWALAETLGVDMATDQEPFQLAIAKLATERTLLLLDAPGFRRDECAELAKRLLETCPKLSILCAANQALPGWRNQALTLTPLQVPRHGSDASLDAVMESDAVILFVARLRESVPDLQLDPDCAPLLGRICRQVDGLPLALELAAACAADQSLGRVSARIADHLEFLEDSRAHRDPRHRSLRAAIQSSLDALTPSAQRLFTRLALFATSVRPDDVAEVCQDPAGMDDALTKDSIPHFLEEVCAKSLLRRHKDVGRLEMLNSLRSFARDRLRSDPDLGRLRQQYEHHYLERAEALSESLQGDDQRSALCELSHIRADCLRILEDAVRRSDSVTALRLAEAIGHYWRVRGPFGEGRFWIDRALSLTGGEADRRARVLGCAGDLAMQQGDLLSARLRFEAALALADTQGDGSTAAGTLRRLGSLADEQGESDRAFRLYTEALGRYRELEDGWGIAATQNNLGMLAMHSGRYAQARESLTESLTCFEEAGDTWAMGVVHFNLGNCAFDEERYSEAREHYLRSQAIAEDLDDAVGQATALRALGNLSAGLGDYIVARHQLRRALDQFGALEDRKHVAETLESMAEVELLDGRAAAATRYLGMASRLRGEIGVPVKPKDETHFETLLEGLREALGLEFFEESWQAGSETHWRSLLA